MLRFSNINAGIRAQPVAWLVILINFQNLAEASENSRSTNIRPLVPPPFLVDCLLVSYGAKLLPPLSTYWPDFLSISKAIISPVDIVHTFIRYIFGIHKKV